MHSCIPQPGLNNALRRGLFIGSCLCTSSCSGSERCRRTMPDRSTPTCVLFRLDGVHPCFQTDDSASGVLVLSQASPRKESSTPEVFKACALAPSEGAVNHPDHSVIRARGSLRTISADSVCRVLGTETVGAVLIMMLIMKHSPQP